VQLTAIHFFHRRVIAAIEGALYVKGYGSVGAAPGLNSNQKVTTLLSHNMKTP
jgi:hypothetical protein